MYDFQFSENFEPSQNTKKWCLYTHKGTSTFAHLQLPGFFQTTYYEWQILGFIGIFLIEGLATYWCFLEGVIITAILASIFIDLVLAVVAHMFQKSICKMKNELFHEGETVSGAIKRRLSATKLRQRFFYLLIFVSALFKIFWFLNVYGIVDATTLFIMTCYLIGAILHITCTGYALFTFVFNRKIKNEHDKYDDSERKVFAFNDKDPLRTQLSSNTLHEAEAGRHRITNADDGNMYLETFGVLSDSELWTMIGRQIEPERKRTLAIDGVRHQMLILEQDPMDTVEKPTKTSDKEVDSLKVVPRGKAG